MIMIYENEKLRIITLPGVLELYLKVLYELNHISSRRKNIRMLENLLISFSSKLSNR